MNTRERFLATMNFETPDRHLVWEFGYWSGTVRRWYKEGLPRIKGIPESVADGVSSMAEYGGAPLNRYSDYDVHHYFKMDPPMVRIPLNIGAYPPFEEKTIEDHGDWYIWQDADGCLRKDFKNKSSLPSFVGGPVTDRESWERYKAERLRPSLQGRLPKNWPELVAEYRRRDYPLGIGQLHGFFGTPRYLIGVEELLVKYYDDPELMKDMNHHLAEFWIALYKGVLREVDVDTVFIWEDMAYKGGPLISPEMFREFLLPGYQKLTSFLREQGVTIVQVDSDGDVWKLIPLWMEGGVTVLYPFEVAAGMDVVEVRKAFPRLGIGGGIDKRALARGKAAIDRELEAKVPFMLNHGGYIPTVDHLVPTDISFENFKYYCEKLKQILKSHSQVWDRD